ncbi:mucin-5AC-like [Penaeus japonicus]|uniref:mucin-5AC-like n=1 Tax=Penaeus japonicus TaxID=27405 RepID=UPI001C70ED19|nr:mucin-5AC-like [Penaeus japonicus]
MESNSNIPYAVLFLTTVLVGASGRWDSLYQHTNHASGLSSSAEESRPFHRMQRPLPLGFPLSRQVRSTSSGKQTASHQTGLLRADDTTSSTGSAQPALTYLLPPPFPVSVPGFHFVPVWLPQLTFPEKPMATSYFPHHAPQLTGVDRVDSHVEELGHSVSEGGAGGDESLTKTSLSSSLRSPSYDSPSPSDSSIAKPLASAAKLPSLLRSSLSFSAPASSSSSPSSPSISEGTEPRVNLITFPSSGTTDTDETLSKDRIIFPSSTEEPMTFPSENPPQPPPVTTPSPLSNVTVLPNVVTVSENNTDIRVSIIAPSRPCTRLCEYSAGSGICLTDFICIRNNSFLRLRPQALKNV